MARKAKKAAENTVTVVMENNIVEALSADVKTTVMSASLKTNSSEVIDIG